MWARPPSVARELSWFGPDRRNFTPSTPEQVAQQKRKARTQVIRSSDQPRRRGLGIGCFQSRCARQRGRRAYKDASVFGRVSNVSKLSSNPLQGFRKRKVLFASVHSKYRSVHLVTCTDQSRSRNELLWLSRTRRSAS